MRKVELNLSQPGGHKRIQGHPPNLGDGVQFPRAYVRRRFLSPNKDANDPRARAYQLSGPLWDGIGEAVQASAGCAHPRKTNCKESHRGVGKRKDKHTHTTSGRMALHRVGQNRTLLQSAPISTIFLLLLDLDPIGPCRAV